MRIARGIRTRLRFRAAVMLSLSLFLLSALPAQATFSTQHVGKLYVDRPVFWDGVFVGDSLSAAFTPEGCASPTVTCIDYTFEVAEVADVLRVALDDPAAMSVFEVHLYDPSGQRVAQGSVSYSVEVWADQPKLGTWTARLVASLVKEDPFRMRAALQNEQVTRAHNQNPVPSLPNLKLVPPFEFTFEMPATLLGPGVDLDDNQPHSCHADETASEGARRCLRFSVGPANAGDGPLQLVFEPVRDGTTTGPVTQVITMSDGSKTTRPAGAYDYHETHAHYHQKSFGSLQLFRVVDEEKGELEHVSTSPKQGFCLQPFKIFDWTSFDQDRADAGASSCEQTMSNWHSFVHGTDMRLARGWADVYSWSLPGNYVDFGSNGDGRYVLTSVADPDDDVLETNEKDNAGYAYIEVSGSTIDILERGSGESPWDPQKEVIVDWVNDNPDDRVPYQPL